MSQAQLALSQEELTRLEILVSLIEDGSGGPAEPQALDRAEASLGRPLPAQLRAWIESVDGAVLADGNLVIDPVWNDADDADELGAIATQTKALRRQGWDLPEELVLIGGNGGDEMFGIWMPADGAGPNVIVALDMAPQPGEPSFWIVGESLLAFLSGWSAAYAHFEHRAIYELLEIPAELQQPAEETTTTDDAGNEEIDEDEALFAENLRFASPSIAAISWPDEEEHAFTSASLREYIATVARQR